MKTTAYATAAALALATAFGGPALAEGMKTQQGAQVDTGVQSETQATPRIQGEVDTGSGMAAGLSGENLKTEEVRAIQQALSDAGHDVTVDGQWGDATAQAVLEYQEQNDLQASGELDPRTVAALGVELEAGRDAGPIIQQAETPDMKPAAPDTGEAMTPPGVGTQPAD